MVLGTDMKKLTFIFACVVCASCNAKDAASEAITDNANIIGLNLQIIDDGGVCILKYEISDIESKLALAPKPPCFLLRRGQSVPQHFEYPDVGVKAALIVAGTLISDEQRKRWGLPSDPVCGSERQGILIYSDKIVVSGNVLKSGIACKTRGSDEKDFWYFAHIK